MRLIVAPAAPKGPRGAVWRRERVVDGQGREGSCRGRELSGREPSGGGGELSGREPSGGGREGCGRGSVLALVPAGFLVLVVLAALAVDSAVAYLGHQQLQDALAAAANDAVSAGLNDASFYRQGAVTIDPAAAARTVCAAIASQGDSALHGITVAMAVDGDSLRLVGSATVDAVFGTALPGFAHRAVSASADASLESGPGRPASPGPLLATFGPPAPLRCG